MRWNMKQLDLSGFHGSEQFARFSPLTKAVLTEGVVFVAQETDNFGLMQDIGVDCDHASKLHAALQDGLVCVDIDSDGFGIKYTDGNGKLLKKYPLSGYPSIKVMLWIALNEFVPTIMLPSEY